MAQPFSIDEFLQQVVDPGKEGFATSVTLVPEYEGMGQIIRIIPRTWVNDENVEQLGVNFIFKILDEQVAQRLELKEALASYFINIDRNPVTKAFTVGPNQNVPLGKLLVAVGMEPNKKFPWGSLIHQTCWIKVGLPRDQERANMSNVYIVGREAPKKR